MGVKPTPAGDIHVSWVISSHDLEGDATSGPIHEFVVRVHDRATDRVRQYELAVDRRSMTVSGLGPGTYDVCVFELNDSGLGAGPRDPVTISPATGESPSPSQPTPTPTPTSSS